MQNSFPHSITGEKDLKLYEDFLNKTTSRELSCAVQNRSVKSNALAKPQPLECLENMVCNPLFFQGYLKKHIGKLIKVESFLGKHFESRVGILYEVGADYLVLKLNRNSCSLVIEASSIRFVTIIHDNDFKNIT